MSEEQFKEWLKREMPEGTVIGNPEWWAKKIWQAALSAKSVLPNQEPRDAQQLKECVWSEEDDENMPNTWNGDCGAMWIFTEGGVKDNSMHYCPECGGKVVIAELANRKGE